MTIHYWIKTISIRVSLVLCLTTMMAACGLAMDSEERLDRAETALAAEDYRAAIIDAKDVLLAEPDNSRARVILGRASVEIGDGPGAEKDLRHAIDLGVPRSDVIVDLGKSLAQQGKYSELIEEVTIESDDSSEMTVQLLQLRAGSFLRLGDVEKARDLYTEVLELDPQFVPAKLGIVSALIVERNVIQARATLDELLTEHPDSISSWITSGNLNMELRQPEQAEGNFSKAIELISAQDDHTQLIPALAGLAEAQFAQNNENAARSTVAQLKEFAPDSISALYLGAMVAFVDEDWGVVQQDLQRVLQYSPDNQAARFLLGRAHLQSGDLAQAEMYLASVVALSPQNIEARTLLAETRVQLNRFDQARDSLSPLLSMSNRDPRATFMASRVSLAEGDLESGIAYLEEALEVWPDNPELKLQLAAAYISAGRLDDADRILADVDVGSGTDGAFRRELLTVMTLAQNGNVDAAIDAGLIVAEEWPERTEIFNLLGYLQLSEKKLDEAREQFETAARSNAADVVSQRFLARIDAADGSFDAARDRYLQIIEQQPGSDWARVELARLALQREDTEVAENWLEEARANDAQMVEPRSMLAILYLAEGRYNEARRVAEEAVALDPDDARIHYMLGQALLNGGNPSGAKSSFSTAVELDPDRSDYHFNLARAQKTAGDTEAATRTMVALWDRGVREIMPAGLLISLRVEEGNLTEALRLAKELQEQNPGNPAAAAFEAEVHVAAKDFSAAVNAYDRAVALGGSRNVAVRASSLREHSDIGDPHEPVARYLDERPLDNVARAYLADSYTRKGQFEEAAEQFARVTDANPGDARILNNLAWSYLQIGDPRAVETARRAYEISPDNPSIADTYGWILIESNSPVDGVNIMRKAVSLDGARPVFRYHLAAGLARMGEVEEARRNLERVLNEDVTFEGRADAEALYAELQQE